MTPKLPTYLLDYGEPQTLPSYTYKFDYETKRIIGHVDGLDAVKQAVYLYLHTRLGKWKIFPDNDYGFETPDLYGAKRSFIKAMIEKRIKEALSIDTRIQDVRDFKIEFESDYVLVNFTVECKEGIFDTEVNINV